MPEGNEEGAGMQRTQEEGAKLKAESRAAQGSRPLQS